MSDCTTDNASGVDIDTSHITEHELFHILLGCRGATFVTVTARTKHDLRKTSRKDRKIKNPYFDGAVKVAVVNGLINWVYENSVNNQRNREAIQRGDDQFEHFVSQPRQWGRRRFGYGQGFTYDNRVSKSGGRCLPFIYHEGKAYLEIKVERVIKSQYQFEGAPLAERDIMDFRKARKKGSGRQGVERQVMLRDYRVEGIEQIKVNGQHYIIDR